MIAIEHENPQVWIKKVTSAPQAHRQELIEKRPIIAWFDKKEPAFVRLIQVPTPKTPCKWMIQGYHSYKQGPVNITNRPEPLNQCLAKITRYNNWELREFPSEIAFSSAVTAHLLRETRIY